MTYYLSLILHYVLQIERLIVRSVGSNNAYHFQSIRQLDFDAYWWPWIYYEGDYNERKR